MMRSGGAVPRALSAHSTHVWSSRRGWGPVPVVVWALGLRALGLALPLLVAGSLGHAAANPWAHWDAVYYTRLADHGYAPYVHGGDHTGLAFLPLYPLLLALPVHLGLPAYVSSAVLSNLCALIAFAALALLLARDIGHDAAVGALVLLAAAPAALFLSLGYSESLYLALSACGFLLLRRARWTGAAALFALAAATRPTGIALALPYLAEWASRYRRPPEGAPRAGLRQLAPLGLLPLALGLVAAYDAALGASPLAYLQAEHAVWHHAWAWPWTTVARQIAALGTLRGAGSSLLPTAILNLAALAVTVPLLVVVARRLPLSYALYTLAVVVMTVGVSGDVPFYGPDVRHPFVLPLVSTHRYLFVAFPLAAGAALVLRRRPLLLAAALVLAAGQVLLAVLFMHGLWAG